jgi:hypothetical protein
MPPIIEIPAHTSVGSPNYKIHIAAKVQQIKVFSKNIF